MELRLSRTLLWPSRSPAIYHQLGMKPWIETTPGLREEINGFSALSQMEQNPIPVCKQLIWHVIVGPIHTRKHEYTERRVSNSHITHNEGPQSHFMSYNSLCMSYQKIYSKGAL